jgi:NTP pyrophosphatase (non-canonical NTP hydrolase)
MSTDRISPDSADYDPYYDTYNHVDHAAIALEAFCNATGDSIDDAVGDLFADLMLYCHAKNIPLELLLERAKDDYEAEKWE